MNRLRQRKLEARDRRQESLRSQGKSVVEKTVINVPQPKVLQKKEKVLVEAIKNVEVKRGRGRPKKVLDTKINKGIDKANNKLIKAKGKK